MSPVGFKARVGSALFALSGGVCYTFQLAAQPVTSPHAPAEVLLFPDLQVGD